jgi:6-phosphogluconate dehydrogenase
MNAQIGIIGLAVMGANIALNIASREIEVSVYNRTTKKMTELIEAHGNEYLKGYEELKDFVESIERPRAIIILVKAGKPVDAVIEGLVPLLDEGDIIVECGNSYYKDTERRFNELKEQGINFFGCGVSGGEEGALLGPSLMPGGHKPSYERLKPILEAIAAKDFQGDPCVTYCGEGPAGHYVKMVHNGIEYGVMQLIAEAYQLLKDHFELDASQIADIFDQYNQGVLKSFLFEITVEVLRQKDEFQDGHLIDYILDKAAQKGTGKWTAIDALDRGIPTPTIGEAVNARIMSSFKDKRVQLSQLFNSFELLDDWPLEQFTPVLEGALFVAMICSYAQGYHLIESASEEEGWGVDLSEASRIWQGGCIIRAEILKIFTEAFKNAEPGMHLFEIPEITQLLNPEDDYKGYQNLRDVVILATESGVAIPCLSASLAYFDTMIKARCSANMIQGLRDNFGAHTYERTDREGSFHTDWLANK